MQITNQFTLGVHIICAIEYFKKDKEVTSFLLASSTGANPVTIRTVISKLKEKDIIDISQGKKGIDLKKDINDISLLDVYEATYSLNEDGLFHFHDKVNLDCPIGKNIHKALDDKLIKIEDSMKKQMEEIKIGDVYKDIIKELNKEDR